MRLTLTDTRFLDLAKRMWGVAAQQGSKVIGASIICVAGKGLTHRQLCSSSQASKGHTPTKTARDIHCCYWYLPLDAH